MHRFAMFFIVPSSTPTVQPTERTAKTISSTEVKKPVGTPRKSVARMCCSYFFISVNFCSSVVFCHGNESETKKNKT